MRQRIAPHAVLLDQALVHQGNEGSLPPGILAFQVLQVDDPGSPHEPQDVFLCLAQLHGFSPLLVSSACRRTISSASRLGAAYRSPVTVSGTSQCVAGSSELPRSRPCSSSQRRTSDRRMKPRNSQLSLM